MCAAAFMNTPISAVHDFGTVVSGAKAGSITPTLNYEVLVTHLAQNSTATVTIDSGFTITDQRPYVGGTSLGTALAYCVQSGKAAIAPTWGSAVVNSATAMFSIAGNPTEPRPSIIGQAVQRAAVR